MTFLTKKQIALWKSAVGVMTAQAKALAKINTEFHTTNGKTFATISDGVTSAIFEIKTDHVRWVK